MNISRTFRHGAAATLAAALLASGSGLGATAPRDWQPGEEDFLLLQIRVEKYKLLNDVRGYQTPAGACADLADVIQALDLPIRLDKKSRRATGWFFAEDQTFTLDRERNAVQIMNKWSDLDAGEVYDTPEGWCIDLASLSRWTGADFRLDMANATIVIESERPLPFIEAIKRKSRAARLRPETDKFDFSEFPQADMPYKPWRTPAVDTVLRLGFTDSPGGASQQSFRYELNAAGEMFGASYTARLASDTNGRPETFRFRAYRFDPEGGMLGPLNATQVAAGDVEAFSGQLTGGGGVGRGVTISNRPLNRPTRFAETTLRGAMPIGWEAEVYRNGQLLAYQGDRGDGRYEFDVNLIYGMNELEVVLYGPQGQIRHDRSSIPVGTNSLRPGETEYWAMVLEQDRDLIGFFNNPDLLESGWRYGVGVERGLDKRTVLGVSANSLVTEGRRRTYAELNLQRAIGPMLVEMTAAQELGSGRAYHINAIGRLGKVNFQAETLWIDGGFTSSLVDSGVRREHSLRLDSTLHLGKAAMMPLQASFRQMTTDEGQTVNEVLTQASLIMRGISLTGELSYTKTSDGGSIDDGVRVSVLANTQILGMRVRGETRFRLTGEKTGFELARVRVEKNLGPRSDLKFEFVHDRDEGNSTYRLGYVRQFRKFALEAQGTYGSDGAIGAGLTLSFSVGPNPNGGGVRMSNEKLARTGQAGVSVFLDENGDGRRSAGEKPLPDVMVSAGFASATDPTDARGMALVEGLRPYQPVLLSIDESSLPDPYLKPNSKGIVVTPRPGVATRIELGVTPTGEIEGVLYSVSDTPREGVELELVDPRGQVAAKAMTEFDGYFLFDRVSYGRYRLRVSESSAKILGVEPVLADGLMLGKGSDLVRIGTIRLKPEGSQFAGGPAN